MLYISERKPNLLYSPMSPSGDSRPASIETFVPSEYPELTNQLQQYVDALGNETHRLFDNYVNINFMDYALVSAWKRNGNIVGFATGWDRDFYPNNSIRLLNRIYHDPHVSRVGFTREVLRPSTFHCIQQQLIMSQRMGFVHAFISREQRAIGFFERFIQALDDRTTHRWEYRKGPFLVAPDAATASCWQSIGLTSLDGEQFWKEVSQ